MDEQKLLEVARGSVEAFNGRDWDRFRSTLAPNAVYDEVGSGRKRTGRDDILETIKGWTQAFSDVEGTIDHTVVSGDTAILEITYRGTHDGTLEGPAGSVGPTGKTIATRCVEVVRISDGLIVENRNYFDMLGMLKALGVFPASAAQQAGA
ncbi:MAG TPA: ester cyclase [Longimicrobiales bacterium]|nr:ester cyclase [Longimicrobiales bacterium]